MVVAAKCGAHIDAIIYPLQKIMVVTITAADQTSVKARSPTARAFRRLLFRLARTPTTTAPWRAGRAELIGWITPKENARIAYARRLSNRASDHQHAPRGWRRTLSSRAAQPGLRVGCRSGATWSTASERKKVDDASSMIAGP